MQLSVREAAYCIVYCYKLSSKKSIYIPILAPPTKLKTYCVCCDRLWAYKIESVQSGNSFGFTYLNPVQAQIAAVVR